MTTTQQPTLDLEAIKRWAAGLWGEDEDNAFALIAALEAAPLSAHDQKAKPFDKHAYNLEGLLNCPACDAGNIWVRPWHDARRQVECHICGCSSPTATNDGDALAKWNAMPRKAAPRPSQEAETRDVWPKRIAEVVEEGDGFWRTCSGCHESEDGYDVGEYPFSKTFNCKVGGGCGECGGLGVIWDDTDYAAMAAYVIDDSKADVAALTPAPGHEAEPVAWRILDHFGLAITVMDMKPDELIVGETLQPLYAHPAPAPDVGEEEIAEIVRVAFAAVDVLRLSDKDTPDARRELALANAADILSRLARKGA